MVKAKKKCRPSGRQNEHDLRSVAHSILEDKVYVLAVRWNGDSAFVHFAVNGKQYSMDIGYLSKTNYWLFKRSILNKEVDLKIVRYS